MHQNTPNYNSDTHFGQLSFIGGALGAQSGFWAEQGGFSEARALVFFQLFFIGPLKRFWGVAMSDLDFTHLSIHPTPRALTVPTGLKIGGSSTFFSLSSSLPSMNVITFS